MFQKHVAADMLHDGDYKRTLSSKKNAMHERERFAKQRGGELEKRYRRGWMGLGGPAVRLPNGRTKSIALGDGGWSLTCLVLPGELTRDWRACEAGRCEKGAALGLCCWWRRDPVCGRWAARGRRRRGGRAVGARSTGSAPALLLLPLGDGDGTVCEAGRRDTGKGGVRHLVGGTAGVLQADVW